MSAPAVTVYVVTVPTATACVATGPTVPASVVMDGNMYTVTVCAATTPTEPVDAVMAHATVDVTNWHSLYGVAATGGTRTRGVVANQLRAVVEARA